MPGPATPGPWAARGSWVRPRSRGAVRKQPASRSRPRSHAAAARGRRGRPSPRHPASPHDARCLVLRDDGAAPAPDALGAAEAVLAHSGEEHAEPARSVHVGDRTEERIRRGTAGVLGRIPVQAQERRVPARAPRSCASCPARSRPCPARARRRPRPRRSGAACSRRAARRAIGRRGAACAGRSRSGRRGRAAGRRGASRGRAAPPVEAPIATISVRAALRLTARASVRPPAVRGSAAAGEPRRRESCRDDSLDELLGVRPAERPDLRDQLGLDAAARGHQVARAHLRRVVVGPEPEGVERRLAPCRCRC